MAARLTPPATPLLVGERHLPGDVLQRLLVGLPLEDHRAAASVCKSFRRVIAGPRFLAERRRCGFAERGIVSVGRTHGDLPLTICMAHSGETARISGNFGITGSTSDGGSRLFVSTYHGDVLALDVSSRRWRRFATLPRYQRGHCLEWHNGLLFLAGGLRDSDFMTTLNSFSAFNEATGLWEELPSMPYACKSAAWGVIGNELFIAGGYGEGGVDLLTLQIYDIAGRTWRLGAALPESRTWAIGVVADGKLFAIDKSITPDDLLVYDPESDAWTEEAPPSTVTNDNKVTSACAHKGRLVVFSSDRRAHERANDGSWSPYEVAGLELGVSESVILG